VATPNGPRANEKAPARPFEKQLLKKPLYYTAEPVILPTLNYQLRTKQELNQ